MTPWGSRVVGYVRVSTADQGDSGAGLQAQRSAIEAEAARRGWQLVAVHEDILSGKSIDRPGLETALAAVRSGDAVGIVVAKLDRLSRSVVDFGRLLQEATRDGWNIVGLDFGLDLTTPQGKLVANVLMSVAEWERDIIAQRTREGLAAKRAQGVRLGRPTEVPIEVARRIQHERFHEGRTLAEIAGRLNADGVTTSRGKSWQPTTVRRQLRR